LSGSISRKLFRRVLLLYPDPFRHEFGDEMVTMFEECRAAQGSWHVLSDVLLSAAKQQIHYLSIPKPKSAPLYSEIACSPNLARILAITMFGVVLLVSVLAVGAKPEARESWMMPCARSRSTATQTTMQLVHFTSRDSARRE
jgi:hypothetical protein